MKKLGLLLALGLAGMACGDNEAKPDAPVVPPIDGSSQDAPTDGTVTPATLTAYVIDLVKNHTNETELPKPFTDFSTLPDPDQTNNNVTAYSTLFQ